MDNLVLPNPTLELGTGADSQHDFSRYCYQHYQLGLGVKTREDMFPQGDRDFAVAGPRAWNTLPDAIRRCSSPDTFKRSLKTHLYIQCYF